MYKHQSFHPRLIIDDHFDEIQNQIDIKTEEMLVKTRILSGNYTNILNRFRQEQLKKIDEVKCKNLSLVDKFDENEYTAKWSSLMDDPVLTYDQKIEIIKEELIVNDCIVIEDKSLESGISLWVTRWFYNKKNLRFLRYSQFNIF
jgi:hypothetical protein